MYYYLLLVLTSRAPARGLTALKFLLRCYYWFCRIALLLLVSPLLSLPSSPFSSASFLSFTPGLRRRRARAKESRPCVIRHSRRKTYPTRYFHPTGHLSLAFLFNLFGAFFRFAIRRRIARLCMTSRVVRIISISDSKRFLKVAGNTLPCPSCYTIKSDPFAPDVIVIDQDFVV